MLSNKTKAWQQLLQHKQELEHSNLVKLFAADNMRFKKFSLRFADILFDYSKQLVTDETIRLLLQLAQELKLSDAIHELFSGALVNKTEQRPALHTELRNPNTVNTDIQTSIQEMDVFVRKIEQSDYTDVLVLGIGGSDLGPRLVCNALRPYKSSRQNIHFIANVDSDTLLPLLNRLNPKTTICLINSKTFTTIETLSNATIVKDWLQEYAHEQCYAITANAANAKSFGINSANIFLFWDFVGGRYSVWSAVGLPIALSIGMDNFKKFLYGAHSMDLHFQQAPLASNLPVLLGLLGIWQINFQHYQSLCIQPYADGLELLPQYLQQLEMESNGKRVNSENLPITYQTAPVIWGGVGCNSQHAYMQMLHQGTQVVPVDFIVAKRNHEKADRLQKLLLASCLGQSQALMRGNQTTVAYKDCPGNRPSNTLLVDCITPELMGRIIALYEHKVYVQGVIWQIQSFDQWGVQLGKELIVDLLQQIDSGDTAGLDSSTAGLLQDFLAESH